uniref:Uncharacterized protein n=1 Tax=Ralstonia syzygii R24 TaxID=907261 RepID=G3A292_9RALS|nr:hypothetical protein RALSY_20124 [Ralstonia syzygii R24]
MSRGNENARRRTGRGRASDCRYPGTLVKRAVADKHVHETARVTELRLPEFRERQHHKIRDHSRTSD